MHDILRERLIRNLEALPEEQVYQVLDYIEFLNSKYARARVRPPASPLRRFSEKLEDQMRLQGVGMNAIRGTLGAMNTADKVVSEIAGAGMSLLKEVEEGLRTVTEPPDRTQVRNLKPVPGKSPEDIHREDAENAENDPTALS
ncbi:MAG: DUF2281 domain-containing protein [Gemmatimonas sp.]|nr:DUF2281 domain-containing protein [Gemmatimonas sp.]